MDFFKYDHRNGMLIPNDEHIIIFFKRVAQPPNNFDGCRDEERLANYWDAGWKQINWRYPHQSPKSHHFSNQQIKTNRNRSKSKKCLKCDSLPTPPTPPTSIFVGFPPHVALATLAPMLIQITVGSTSTWSLQLDLPSVASVGDTP